MSEPIVELKDVSMRFNIETRHYGLKNMILHLNQYVKDRKNKELFTALDHVNLSFQRGERVALVGHNGSGKTTMLSVIGGIYKRFEGEVNVRGRISMMLALGAGFSPQLSGRENIVLNGVLQGMTRQQMMEKMDDIIEFADIGRFIDAPVYQYSSGMQARLGFGVATAIEPEILLVDEVMAVGDANFKEKCEKRINKLLDKGTTLFLVSHTPADVYKYCQRAVKLDHGKVVADGTVEEVLGPARR